MIKKIVFALLGVIALYLAICPLGPKLVDAETVKTVSLSPDQVYGYFSNFKEWPRWSVWITEDPDIKLTFGDTTQGLGAHYSWLSKKSGNGNMTITRADANSALDYTLDFEGMGTNYSEVRIRAVEQGSEVRWRLYSKTPTPFVLRGMMWLFNFNKRITADFDKGINKMASLK
jgi:hypothetical protein